MKFRCLSLILAAVWLLPGAAQAIPAKAVTEAVELGAKISGRTLSPAARAAAEAAARTAARQYGDDVVRLVGRGGLEMLEQGARHGDEFWRLALRNPEAARSLALHGDQLLPLARRVGPEVLVLEAKAPGLAARVAAELGDDMVAPLARASADDASRLLGYAAKADSPATRALLLEKYRASRYPARFLEAFNWSRIMATGLSAAAIVAAYKISDGIESGVEILAEKHPEHFVAVLGTMLAPFRWGLLLLWLILLYPLARWSWRLGRKFRSAPSAKAPETERKDDR